MVEQPFSNDTIAGILEQIADLLEFDEKNRYRIRSYRNAAQSIRAYDTPLHEIFAGKGIKGLRKVPEVGTSIAGVIRDTFERGRPRILDRLDAERTPEKILTRVPGIGKKRAAEIHSKLRIETLEDLEQAAYSGSLQNIEGMGEQRIEGIRHALAGILSRSASRRAFQRQHKTSKKKKKDKAQLKEPPVGLLLKLDKEYRKKAERDELKKIAPKRFNPENKQWLPIMKTRRKGWTFTILFSNTKRAHDLDKIYDWVVIYYSKNGEENRCTVITAESGGLKGKRIIPGKEAKCYKYYARKKKA